MANADNILVGSGGKIYIAATNTALPTTIGGALDNNFIDLGYLSEDGITLSSSVDIADITAFQSLLPVRKVVTARTFDLSFVVREWSQDSVKFAFGGGTFATAGGTTTFTPPSPADGVYERSLIAEWNDGAKDYRIVINRCIVSEGVESNITRADAVDLPQTVSVLSSDENDAGYYMLTNDPALD